ncbi:hypothetical protein INR49_015469, partial [Caranx melampygus]
GQTSLPLPLPPKQVHLRRRRRRRRRSSSSSSSARKGNMSPPQVDGWIWLAQKRREDFISLCVLFCK